MPGTARAARFGVGDAPLGGIYLPDANVTFGYQLQGSQDCTDWLVASLDVMVQAVADADGDLSISAGSS